ncbi:MAG TPA: hypothetical protein VK841_13410 [Polyangiaceae bacterium]|jgi:hypothetical protein|nr:hypothetical protein [Polyangiaceae bacterium]
MSEEAGPPSLSGLHDPRATRVPVVATPARVAACTAIFGCAFAALVRAYVTLSHSQASAAALVAVVVLFCSVTAAIFAAILRAEEARLGRELRTARTGTTVLRSMLGRRRQQVPILGRLFSTPLGTAANLVADGDPAAATLALAGIPAFMQGGRADRLRAVVEADIDRAKGTAAGRDRVIAELRAMPRIGHREADLYRLNVLVKAILERGDDEAGEILASELESSRDEEERMYAAWLRVWFELDAPSDPTEAGTGAEAGASADAGTRTEVKAEATRAWPPLDEGQARLAALVARAQGAEQLVDKLEERLLAIAHEEPRE